MGNTYIWQHLHDVLLHTVNNKLYIFLTPFLIFFLLLNNNHFNSLYFFKSSSFFFFFSLSLFLFPFFIELHVIQI
ncbi:hypothetical protein J3Q64DRAFT_1750475 [Phycomyces blakesleeanus]|uniref:Uncharacterized protein n=1 Tax=Phycomyces blakesleeanus TaxID=4837 RepID=A0ABR3AUR0_PHYBL